MRVSSAPLERGRSYARRARMAGSRAALCLAAASCADVLDLPEQPRLGAGPAVSPRPARSGRVAEPELDVVSGADELTAAAGADVAPAGQGQLSMPEFEESKPAPLSTPVAVTQPSETSDAGAPSDALIGRDASTPLPSGASCAASAVAGPEGGCYLVLSALRTWSGARERCRSIGAGWDLAAIRSDQVNRFLTELLSGEAWIGASDGDVEGRWRWVDDPGTFWRGDSTGSPVGVAYVNWQRTQPNGGADADCARMMPAASGEWGDLPCVELRGAVCEGPAG